MLSEISLWHLLVLFALPCAVGWALARVVAREAAAKGREYQPWFWIGFFLPVVSLIVVFALSPTPGSAASYRATAGDQWKTCPACAERVRREALRCRYCAQNLATARS